MTDWRAWHAAYDDLESSRARRLLVVRRHVRDALASRDPPRSWRIASLCAGDGRDLLLELANAQHRTVRVVLVARDPAPAEDARTTAERLGLEGVRVAATVAATPVMLRPGGTVIWTEGAPGSCWN